MNLTHLRLLGTQCLCPLNFLLLILERRGLLTLIHWGGVGSLSWGSVQLPQLESFTHFVKPLTPHHSMLVTPQMNVGPLPSLRITRTWRMAHSFQGLWPGVLIAQPHSFPKTSVCLEGNRPDAAKGRRYYYGQAMAGSFEMVLLALLPLGQKTGQLRKASAESRGAYDTQKKHCFWWGRQTSRHLQRDPTAGTPIEDGDEGT